MINTMYNEHSPQIIESKIDHDIPRWKTRFFLWTGNNVGLLNCLKMIPNIMFICKVDV